jgi:purine-binding chemotaxis protein CheW
MSLDHNNHENKELSLTLINNDGDKYLIVRVKEFYFGIGVSNIRDVLNPHEITYVPLAGSEVSGTLNLRGRIVTALDLRYILGLGLTENVSKQMSFVVEYDHELYSFVIDEIGDIISIDEKAMDPTPDNLNNKWREFAKGVFKQEQKLILVIDIQEILKKIFTHKK